MSGYKNGGLKMKYTITKNNGKPLDPQAKYFVLRVDKDPHARVALQAYVNSVAMDNAELAQDLQNLLDELQSESQFKPTAQNTSKAEGDGNG